MSAKSQKVIYKTFGPAGWKNGDGLKIKYPNTIDKSDLHNERMVRTVPGIYQRRLSKRFEVRATFFGEKDASIRIDSQNNSVSVEDWRASISPVGQVSPIELPDSIRRSCIDMMAQLKIRLACFDFVVEQDGTYNFLELNQQGQFLWVEELAPSMRMLERFVHFLESEYETSTEGNRQAPIDFKTASQSQWYAHASLCLSNDGAVDSADSTHE